MLVKRKLPIIINGTFFLLFLFVFVATKAQKSDAVIHLKKESAYFLFFQQGKKTDTINNSQNNIFYLLIPDTLKEELSFNTENAQIARYKNDSLVKVNYLPGLKYEYLFEKEKSENDFEKKDKKTVNTKKGSFKSLINGATDLSPGLIRIQVYNRKTQLLLHEINLYYKP